MVVIVRNEEDDDHYYYGGTGTGYMQCLLMMSNVVKINLRYIIIKVFMPLH